MSGSETILALEIGSSDMKAFVGEIVDSARLNIVSKSKIRSAGVKKGDIIDMLRAANLAQKAIISAEETVKIHSNKAYLAMSGTHISGDRIVGSANISSADGIVKEQDITRAKDDAKTVKPPQGCSYIHMISCGFYLDGEFCENPLGKQGTTLEAEYWMVYGEDEKIANAMHVIESFGMEVKEIVHSALASALVVSSKKQRNEGVLVVDMGAGTCDYALFKRGRSIHVGTIPVGGKHVTNDISFALQTSLDNAEKLKQEFGKIILTDEERNTEVWIKGDKEIGDKPFMMGALNLVVRARLGEIFELLKDELAEHLAETPLVLLTGGMSQTDGIELLAQSVLKRPCEIARFEDWVMPNLCKPEFASALGLLCRALADSKNSEPSSSRANWFSKIFKK